MYQEIILFLIMHANDDWARLYEVEPDQVDPLQQFLWNELNEAVSEKPQVWVEAKVDEFLA